MYSSKKDKEVRKSEIYLFKIQKDHALGWILIGLRTEKSHGILLKDINFSEVFVNGPNITRQHRFI